MTFLDEIPKTLGRYTVESRLGVGGMAEAFLASQGETGFKRAVVVKRLLPHLWRNQPAIDRFLREAKVGMRLAHPNIVRVFELAQDEETYFMAMEYVAGLALNVAAKRAWSRGEDVPRAVALRAVCDAARGLDYAHNLVDESGAPRPLVHRDISPDNLMVSHEGVTKILDFGIVKQTETSGPITKTGELKGKIGFMAPEQLEGDEIDGRADLFALGVTAYWLLAKERPFRGKNEIMVIRAVMDTEPVPLHVANKQVPEDVSAIVMGMLQKDVSRRTQSAAEVVQQLQGLVGRTDPTGEAATFVGRMLLDGPSPQPIDGLPQPSAYDDDQPEMTASTRIVFAELPSLPEGFLVSAEAPAGVEPTVIAPAPLPPIDQTLEEEVPLGFVGATAPLEDDAELKTELDRNPIFVGERFDESTEAVTRVRGAPAPPRRTGLMLAIAALVLAIGGVVALWPGGGVEAPSEDLATARDDARDAPAPTEPSLASTDAATIPAEAGVPADTDDHVEVAADAEVAANADVEAEADADGTIASDDDADEEVLAEADEADDADDGEDDDDLADDADPAEDLEAFADGARRVTTVAPSYVRWVRTDGSALGRGATSFELPVTEKRILALNDRTGGRVRVRVQNTIDWGSLRSGKVNFLVLPWAEVRVGARELGTTPFKPVSLRAGTYRIKLTYRDQSVTRKVRVRAGKTVTVKQDFRK